MAQTVVPWIPLWAVRGRGSRAASTGWRCPRICPAPDNRVTVEPTAASACSIGRTTCRPHRTLVTETKRMLRRLGFWIVVTHSHGEPEHDAPVRHAVLRHRPARVRARSVLPHPRRRESLRRRRVVLPVVGGRQPRPDDRRAGAAGRRSHQGRRNLEVGGGIDVRARSVQPRRHHRVELQQGRAVLLGRLRLPARRRRRHAAGSRAHVLRRGGRRSRAARSAGFACPAARCSRSSSFSRSCRRRDVPWNRVGPDAHLASTSGTCRSGTTTS